MGLYMQAGRNLYDAFDVAHVDPADIYRNTTQSHPNRVLTFAERVRMVTESQAFFAEVYVMLSVCFH